MSQQYQKAPPLGGEDWKNEPPPRRKGQRDRTTSRGKRPRPRESAQQQQEVVNMDVLVRIPKHSSVLSQRPFYFYPQPSKGSHHSCKDNDDEDDNDDESWKMSSTSTSTLHLELRCHHPGVLWRGLLPMLFASSAEKETTDSSSDTKKEDGQRFQSNNTDPHLPILREKSRRCTKTRTLPQRTLLGLGLEDAVQRHCPVVPRKRRETTTGGQRLLEDDSTHEDHTENQLFYEQRVPLSVHPGSRKDLAGTSQISVVVWIVPPLRPPSDMDRTPFARILARIQHKAKIQHGWTGWLSTLGGGYFGIKSLAKSLWLARQQRNLAIWLGDAKMARQCTLNEAYNWIHSGRFQLAGSLLNQLEAKVARATNRTPGQPHPPPTNTKPSSCYTTDDEKFLTQISAARVFLRRIQKLSQNGLEKYHRDTDDPTSSSPHKKKMSRTHDDFQRIRIVSC